jgi:O-antigen/teichoic acid export membrane protein
LFFAVYFNLSIWYKLIDKTYWGTIFSVTGFVVIIAINIFFIPQYSYRACAWSAFIGNGLIMLLSYFVGQKNYLIKYDLKTIGIYTALAAILYAVSCAVPLHETWMRIGFNTLLLPVYLFVFYKRDFCKIRQLH